MFKIKPNDNLFAIFTYINSCKYHVYLQELIQFCIDYEYYKELYENFHIVKSLLDEHNQIFTKIRDPKLSGVDTNDEDVPDYKTKAEDDSLL